MSNYPDDIHQYDDDPRSPFYDGPDYYDELEDDGITNCDDNDYDYDGV